MESTAAAFRTKDISELTWDCVATTLIDEHNAKESSGWVSGSTNKPRNRRKKNKRGGSSTTNRVDNDHNDRDDSDSDIESTVRAFGAALRSTKFGSSDTNNNYHREFCDKDGYTEDRCWLNPDNPNNKLPAKVRQRFASQPKTAAVVNDTSKSSKKSGKSKVEIAGAVDDLVHKTNITPPKHEGSYADSGATCHRFYYVAAFFRVHWFYVKSSL